MNRLVLTIIFTLIVNFSYASEKPVWVETDGEAYQSEVETPKEVMARAKMNAQNRAVEQAVGTFIKSHTFVSNNQVAEDLIYAAVRGKIEKIEIIKEGWDEKDRNLYCIKLKALVKPVCPEKLEGISIKLSLSKTDLREGDEVKLFYQANSDSYIYIFSVAADGSVTLLLPNLIHKDNFTKTDKTYEFPPSDSPIKLKAMFLPEYKDKTAEEKIKVIATKNREDIIPLGFQRGFFTVYDAKSTGMLGDLVKRLNPLAPAEWTEATAVYMLKR